MFSFSVDFIEKRKQQNENSDTDITEFRKRQYIKERLLLKLTTKEIDKNQGKVALRCYRMMRKVAKRQVLESDKENIRRIWNQRLLRVLAEEERKQEDEIRKKIKENNQESGKKAD